MEQRVAPRLARARGEVLDARDAGDHVDEDREGAVLDPVPEPEFALVEDGEEEQGRGEEVRRDEAENDAEEDRGDDGDESDRCKLANRAAL